VEVVASKVALLEPITLLVRLYTLGGYTLTVVSPALLVDVVAVLRVRIVAPTSDDCLEVVVN